MQSKIDALKVEKQAKEILDKFASALEKVEMSEEEIGIERKESVRTEGKGEMYDTGFKKRFLENSPKHDDEFVIAEKGGWK